jgi:hypothetical protein
MVIPFYSRLKIKTMKKIFITTGLTLLLTGATYAQVGIGTETPQASIDIAGTVRVTQIAENDNDDISLTGVTGSNILNQSNLGANLRVENNELSTAPVSKSIGTFDLGAVPADSEGNIDALDLFIDEEEANEYTTFLRMHSYTEVINIGGIVGGTEGRHLTLYLAESVNVRFLEDAANSAPQDRFITLANSQLTANGQAILEMVYDADAGPDGLGRWLILKFRS